LRESGPAVDLWALGCVIFQVATGEVLFAGDSEDGQFRTIRNIMSAPDWPGWQNLPRAAMFARPRGKAGERLCERLRRLGRIGEAVAALLRWDPEMRITAEELQKNTEEWVFPAAGENLARQRLYAPKTHQKAQKSAGRFNVMRIGLNQELHFARPAVQLCA
jgi:serine/threonine protein kinase